MMRIGVTLCAVIAAYHYSLRSLMRSLQYDTPLAYLGLVPVVALGLAGIKMRSVAAEPPIHDRHVDYIVGVPMLATALAINLLMPGKLSTMFWVWRVDLLSLPLYVAGSISLVFGVRMLWRLRLPVLFLFLACPLPYTVVLLRYLDSFTELTLMAVKSVLRVVYVARPVPGGDGTLFRVGSGPTRFDVSIATSCSGVNGTIGFVLVCAAFAPLVVGRLINKLLWFAAGITLIWSLNVFRIVMIFFAGNWWGEGVAINGLHPFLGLVTFNLGVVAMLLLMRRFRLQFRALDTRSVEERAAKTHRRKMLHAVPRAKTALAIVCVVGASLATINATYRDYDLVASDLGSPKLAAFIEHPSQPDGWKHSLTATFPWASRFFGDDARWSRWSYAATGAGSLLHSGAPIYADVINTSDLASFSTYGIEACYQFHGYTLHDTRKVSLGAGIVGNIVSYHNTRIASDWTNVYWYWPVKTSRGTRYERINLMITDGASTQILKPNAKPSVTRVIGLDSTEKPTGIQAKRIDNRKLHRTEEFLVAFARQLVDGQIAASHARPAATVRKG